MNTGRIDALDGLRAVAVLGVIFMHAGFRYGCGFGVQIFFVLSGFLITKILTARFLSEDRIKLLDFYRGRIVRLSPALIFLFTVLVPYCVWFAPAPFGIATAWGMLYNLLLIQNIAATYPSFFQWGWLGVLGQTWTLAVEWHFYIVWPLLLMFLLKRVQPQGVALFALGAAAALIVVRGLAWHYHAPISYLVNATEMNLDGLLIGAAVALSAKRWTHAFVSNYAMLCALMACVVVSSGYLPSGVGINVYIAVFEIATAVIVINLAAGARNSVVLWFFQWPAVVYIGRISYGLYLWHFPVHVAMEASHRFNMKDWPHLVPEFGITFFGAVISYHFVELPISRAFRTRKRSASAIDAVAMSEAKDLALSRVPAARS